MTDFQTTVWDYFQQSGRHDLPWRLSAPDGSFDPYGIMVSELMLQQTQVPRALPKYQEFLQHFPTVQVLATAELGEVLKAWSGLGYNRRAEFLWQAAEMVVTDFGGTFPRTTEELISLPGIGRNTAGAIQAYAFNQPIVFIETNIRTVYIHHFFHDEAGVSDAAISELVAQTLDHEQPREWYWALMDYGSHLKRTIGNVSKQSKTYAKQTTFAGSKRQVRGQVLKQLTAGGATIEKLAFTITDERLAQVLADLVGEDLIRKTGDMYSL